MTQRPDLSQGARANASGKTFEDMLTPLFANYGFELMTYREFRDERGVMVHSGERIAVRNVPYQTIYGTPGRTEWVLYDPDGLGSVRIEAETPDGYRRVGALLEREGLTSDDKKEELSWQ